jgi:DNA-binding MarR family transcriptional regulator
MAHPATELDDLIQQRVRLGVLAILVEVGRCDFGYLKQNLEVTDGNLSSHLRLLESAGYIRIDKTFEGKRPRTWVQITKSGERAFDAHMRALQQLVRRHGGRARSGS